MIIMNIEFPSLLIEQMFLESKLIPCICKISGEINIDFSPPISTSVFKGVINNVANDEIESRIIPCVGGQYYSINHSQITIEKVEEGSYQVLELKLFNLGPEFGWTTFITGGSYGPVL